MRLIEFAALAALVTAWALIAVCVGTALGSAMAGAL